jgi:voltage-gated potassium channel
MTEHEHNRTFCHRYRYAIVLLSALLLAVAQPLLSKLMGEDSSFDVLFSVLIAAVLLQVFEEKGQRRTALSLGVVAFVGLWAGRTMGGSVGPMLLIGALLSAASFFTFALYGILRGIFARHVSGDAVFGAVCGYLLLGIIWSLLFYAVEIAWPGSFNLPAAGDSPVATRELDRGVLTYFSFVTLATVGYGDITPATPLARTLAWTEAITGQFYLAILVAGLVGFKVTQATKPQAGP